MAPTWRKYRNDTNIVTTWLPETAEKCGYLVPSKNTT